jgi:predicted GNAT family acetyltransferase
VRGTIMEWKYENERIYSVDENNELLAETTFVLKENGEMDITHTYVKPALRGQGVAGSIIEVVAKHFREKGLKTTASCTYANRWLSKRRDEYNDIISKDFDDEDY